MQQNLAAGKLAFAEDRFREFRAARTDQTCEAENLAAVQRNADVLDQIFSAYTARFKHDLADLALSLRELRVDGPADHELDDALARQLADGRGVNHFAVPLDRNAVRDGEDFIHFV